MSLISTFFAQGTQSQAFANAVRDSQRYRWVEK
jgi:hypothetical protein